MSRTRIKICGITRSEDGLCAAKYGADAIGLVFYPPSPRFVSIDQAMAITTVMPAFVNKVGVFVDTEISEIQSILNNVQLDVLQFHGEEPESICNSFNLPYIKAIRMHANIDLEKTMNTYPTARGFLLDTHNPGLVGGTGEHFDWKRVPQNIDRPIILAGGLNSANVTKAINVVLPYAVDISGGVESEKGIKDADKIREFVDTVFNANKEPLTEPEVP